MVQHVDNPPSQIRVYTPVKGKSHEIEKFGEVSSTSVEEEEEKEVRTPGGQEVRRSLAFGLGCQV